MAEKVQAAREAIADIEDKAKRIKEEIDFLLESDERMQTDEAYRNRLIGDKLREVQKLQEQSQAHQRIIIQYQSSAVETSSRVTRSRAASQSSLSTVAVNIQQAARSTRSATAAIPAQSKARGQRSIISEEDQKRSVQALFFTRKWLRDREHLLQSSLEKAGLEAPIPDSMYEEYAAVSSLRVWTESLCSNLMRDSGDSQSAASLKQIIGYVASLAS